MKAGQHEYTWDGEWAKTPESAGWAHHGVAVLRSGDVVTFHAGEPDLLVLAPDGSLRRRVTTPVMEAHGMTLVEEDGVELLWVADPGVKMLPDANAEIGYGAKIGSEGGQVVKLTLDGELVTRLARPPAGSPYNPTWIAVDERRHGGSGDVWVADGYGQSLVHRFTESGEHVATFDGGDNRFNCPHAILIDRRTGSPLLYVADRGNARVQVLDMEGNTQRIFGQDFMLSPSAMATFGDYLIIGELNARLTVCDADDNLVAYLGSNTEVCSVEGWPNSKDSDGRLIRSTLLQPGKFNSPHGMAVDADGSVYVAEWLIGGRFTKLTRT